MIEAVYPLTYTGYSLLEGIAKDQPSLFSEPDDLKRELESRVKLNAEEGSKAFASNPKCYPKEPLEQLTNDVVKGPKHDEEHALRLRRVFPELTAFEMSDPRVLASINCFHIASYVRTRWSTSSLAVSTEREEQTKFIKLHYLGRSKESNTIARLWWLYEFAFRTSEHSIYDFETLLEKMANNVNFYHQILQRSYLMASDHIRAAVLDVGIASGLADENKTSSTNKVMQSLTSRRVKQIRGRHSQVLHTHFP